MSEMAAKVFNVLWQGQGILARPSSKTLVEFFMKNIFQATIISMYPVVGPLVVQVKSIHPV